MGARGLSIGRWSASKTRRRGRSLSLSSRRMRRRSRARRRSGRKTCSSAAPVLPALTRPMRRPPPLPLPPLLRPPSSPPAYARPGPPILSLNLSLNPMPLTFAAVGDAGGSRGSPNGSGSGSAGSGQLTPAGAVVQAYKRGLDASPLASPRDSPLPSPSSATFKRSRGGMAGSPSPPATPYYTVFGSTSGRVVAIGGPEDAWDGAGSYISASAFPSLDGSRPRSAKPTPSPSVGRTLTRKVSERWVRKREGSEEEVRGRASMQGERRSKKRSGSRADEPHSPGDPNVSWSGSALSHPEDGGFVNEPRSRRSEPAMGGGSKIWKLMKRISTGGLKEKYDRGPRTLPPIPPLPPLPNMPTMPQVPRDTLEARTALSSDGHSREEPNGVARFMQSRTSMSTSRSTSGSTIPRAGGRALPMPPPIPASQQRASTTTRSSSPVSSDVASSKFFPKTTSSARSSTSSLGEDPAAPPLPGSGLKVVVGKHIVPPKDLFKLDLGELAPGSLDENKTAVKPMAFFGTQNLRNPDDWTIVNTPAEEHPPSLPHPPRRLPVPNAYKERPVSNNRFSHVSIPEFSTAAPINAFATRKLPSTEGARAENVLASLGPTPSRRMSSAVDEPSTRQASAASSSAAPTTARQKRMQQRSTSLPRAEPVTFRDMSEKQALTEKEKADRWDDLLQRSERAGGTIHLGTSEQLPSDDMSLRYSTSSTQLLNDF
ncbi:hypothetical protein C8R46DRAFT_433593 [Mycena filopes]|nr:hypothetical protein C8R46DRAFT_433593 [Mycena filopes]